jgi:PKD repeat protein
MKKHTQIFASSVLAAALIITPLTSFAADNTARQANVWSKISQWFGTAKVANAQMVKNKVPVISGITAPTVIKTGQTATWKIKAFDPENTALTYAVDWGDTNGAQGLKTAAFVQTSTFTHAYSNPGVYTVTFTVMDESGLKTTSSVTVHVKGEPVVVPTISNVSATSTKPKQGTLSWTTDVKADSVVWYSTVSPVVTSGTPNISKKAKVTDHKINLTKLEPNTTYYVVVGSSNENGSTMGSETSFTTPPEINKNNPVITSVSGDTSIEVGETETVTVKAYDPKNTALEYSVDWGDTGLMSRMAATEPVFEQTSTFTHEYDAAGTYTATFTVKNEAGLTTSSSLVITVSDPAPDTTAPVQSDIEANADASTSTITWTTDEPTTSKVYYGLTTPIDTTSTSTAFVSSNTLTTEHSLDISGLATSTKYYFVVSSADEAGNKTTSTEMNFTTIE